MMFARFIVLAAAACFLSAFASKLPSLEGMWTDRSKSLAVDFLKLVVYLLVLPGQVLIEAALLSFLVDGV